MKGESKKMKIVLTRSMVPGDIQYIRDGLKDIEYDLVVPSEFTEEGILKEAKDADVLLGPYVTKKILEEAKQLKLIQVPWTGMDTFDFSAVQGCSVPVCNTHSNADAVTELAMTILLDLLKKVSYHDRKMRAGNWNRDQQPLDLKSKMLRKQTVCILGYGNIGSRIGKLISAFGSKLLIVDDRIEGAYKNDQIETAMGQADVVICTIPLTDKTRGLIDEQKISAMKDGVILINMSRAPLMKEEAVWNGLNSGKIGAFGSDVWWNAPKRGESESYPSATYPFWKLDNVVMSPHRAGFVEGCLPHLDGAIENLIALAKGQKLAGIVDTYKGF